MTKLREKTVQAKAIVELESYYRNHRNAANICSRCEVQTVKTKGRKRADGLLCFKTENNLYYTISFEAKSHRTLSSLLSSVNGDKIGMHSILASLTVTLITCSFLLSGTDLQWYYVLLIAIVTLPLTFFISSVLFDLLDLDHHKSNGVIEQLKQYPANEQWVVYSKYTNNLLASTPSTLKKEHIDLLKKKCSVNRFGLLLIGSQKAEVIIEPKPKKGNFLQFYSKQSEIRKNLDEVSLPNKTKATIG